MKNIKTQRIHQKDRSDPNDKANEDHLHEEAMTPTYVRMFLMETKVNKIVQKRTNAFLAA